MPKVYYIRVRTPKRSTGAKRPAASQRTLEAGAGATSAAPPAFAFDSPAGAPVFSLSPTPSQTTLAARPTAATAHDFGKAAEAPSGLGGISALVSTLPDAAPTSPPEYDERYQQVTHRLSILAKAERSHKPLTIKMQEAKSATRQPMQEPVAVGMSSHVDAMAAAKDSPAETPAREESFEAVLQRALNKIALRTSSEMKDFAKNPDRKIGVLADVQAGVEEEKKGPTKELQEAAQHLPPRGPEDPPAKDVPALPNRSAPDHIGAQDVLPDPKPEDEVSFEQDQKSAEDAVAKTTLTEEELAASNEPSFEAVLKERDKVLDSCKESAQQYREAETGFLKHSAQELSAGENNTRFALRHAANTKHSDVRVKQEDLAHNSTDERQSIASAMQSTYVAAKSIVDNKLAMLGPAVDSMFSQSFNILFELLQENVRDELEAWEDKRHSSLGGKFLWWKDKAVGTSHLEGAKKIYEKERLEFEKHMGFVFKRIAKFVDRTLAECRKAITDGQEALAELISDQRDPRLKKFAEQTATLIKSDFEGLQQTVEEKKNDLANSLANHYKDSRATVDKWIEAEKDKHRGILGGLWNMAVGIYEAVVNFKNKLLNILRKGIELILSIVRHPIRFLENLVASVKKGIGQFAENIADHLREAALGWLLGEVPSSAIHIPKDLSPASIFGLVMEILGLTPEKIRARAAHIVGEQNVQVLERVFSLLHKYFVEGPAALWEELQSMLGDLKDAIIEGVRDWVLAQVIRKGLAQLALMLNPVGAFIEACLAIYNLIVFFIDHARQIGEMLEGIFDSIQDMVDGKIDAAAVRIENAMTRSLTLLLGFLTSLINIPSPASAIHRIVSSLQDKVYKAVDWLLEKFKKLAMNAGVAIKTAAHKAFRLLFPVESFGANGEHHTIEAVQAGEEYPIVVHSKGMDLEALIEEAKDKRVKGATALERAYKAYQKIHIREIPLQDKKERDALEDKTAAEGEKKIKAYKEVAALIKDVFPRIPSIANRTDKTLITYGPLHGEFGGSSMTAHPLAHDNWDKGSEPKHNLPPVMIDPSWPASRKERYKRGHLLNQLLGGPGDEARNLTPLTSSANGLHSARVESKIKEIVKPNNHRLMHYDVHVNYPGSKRTPPAGSAANKVEGNFAISLATKWYELEPAGKGYKEKDGGAKGEETIPNVPPYP